MSQMWEVDFFILYYLFLFLHFIGHLLTIHSSFWKTKKIPKVGHLTSLLHGRK